MEIVTHVRSLFALTAATVIASATTALAQATDHCADAPNLTADGSYPFDLTGATADGAAACPEWAGPEMRDVWYTYTAPADGYLIVDTCGVPSNGAAAILSGCGGTVLCCPYSNVCAGAYQAEVDVVAGQTVAIRIFALPNGVSDSGNLNITLGPARTACTPMPTGAILENEPCGTSINGGCQSGAFFDLPATPFDLSIYGSSWRDEEGRVDVDFYRLNLAGGTGSTRISASLQGDMPLKIQLIALDGFFCCISPFSLYASADLINRCSDTAAFTITVPDGAYAIIVFGAGLVPTPCGSAGGNNYALSIRTEQVTLLPGDTCETALPAVLGSNQYDTNGYTIDPVDLGYGSYRFASPSQWFSYTAAHTGILQIDTCGDPSDTLVLLKASCGSPVPGTISPGCGSPMGQRFLFPATAGTTYHIRFSAAAEFGVVSGPFHIAELVAPVNDQCAGALDIGEGEAAVDLSAATTDGPPSQCALNIDGRADSKGLWYRFTSPRDGVLRVTSRHSWVMSISDSCGGPEIECGFTPIQSPDCDSGCDSVAVLSVLTGRTVLIRVSTIDGSDLSGNFDISVVATPVSCVVIPPGATSETEACGDSIGAPTLVPSLPSTFAGTLWADRGLKDQDLYQFSSPAHAVRMTITLRSDLPVRMVLSDANDPNIPEYGFADAARPCIDTATIATISGRVSPLNLPVEPLDRTGYPCGIVNNYVLTFDAVPLGACCTSTGGLNLTRQECDALGGTYLGDGTITGAYASSVTSTPMENVTTTQYCPQDQVEIGFGFNYFGTTYTQLNIANDGFVQFDGREQTSTNYPLPSPYAPLNAIFGLQDSFRRGGGANGRLNYQTLGEAPNRRFIAQWSNYEQGFFDTGGTVNFEIVLFEANSAIELRYGNIRPDPRGGRPNADYTVGLQNIDASYGVSIDTSTLGTGNTARLFTFTPSCNPCPPDFNIDGALNADDLSDFVTGYFNTPADPRTDFNHDGTINADDLADFITAYFNGC